jgi:hypothetical protein
VEIFPYTLIDAEAQHRKSPRTFDVPSKVVVASLKPGDLVKVGAQFDVRVKPGDTDPPMRAAWERRIGQEVAGNVGAERFWVRLTHEERGPKGTRQFRGTVENDLVYKAHHGLDCGQEMAFEGRHLLDWMRAENEVEQSALMAAMGGGILVPRDGD